MGPDAAPSMNRKVLDSQEEDVMGGILDFEARSSAPKMVSSGPLQGLPAGARLDRKDHRRGARHRQARDESALFTIEGGARAVRPMPAGSDARGWVRSRAESLRWASLFAPGSSPQRPAATGRLSPSIERGRPHE